MPGSVHARRVCQATPVYVQATLNLTTDASPPLRSVVESAYKTFLLLHNQPRHQRSMRQRTCTILKQANGTQHRLWPAQQQHTIRRCLRVHTRAAAAEQPTYPYNSGEEGRQQKATIEHIFKPDVDAESNSSSTDRVQAPWAVGWQMSERNIMWNDELKLRLIKRIASQELQISESDLEERLQQLYNLLPDLAARLVKAPPKRVAQLAANTDVIAARLLRLREMFPKASISDMVNNRLTLLLDDDLDQIAAAAVRLRELLPQLLVDKFVEAFPLVLDVEDFEMALEDAKRIMPGMDVPQMLRSNPDMILSLQKGKNLIPYDQIDNPWS